MKRIAKAAAAVALAVGIGGAIAAPAQAAVSGPGGDGPTVNQVGLVNVACNAVSVQSAAASIDNILSIITGGSSSASAAAASETTGCTNENAPVLQKKPNTWPTVAPVASNGWRANLTLTREEAVPVCVC